MPLTDDQLAEFSDEEIVHRIKAAEECISEAEHYIAQCMTEITELHRQMDQEQGCIAMEQEDIDDLQEEQRRRKETIVGSDEYRLRREQEGQECLPIK